MAEMKNVKLATEDKFKIAFTLLVVLYPIFNRYKAPIPILTMSEFALMLFFIMAAVRFRVTSFPVIWSAFALCVYMAFDIAVNSMELKGASLGIGAGTALRIVCIYFLYAFLANRFMNKRFGERALVLVSLIVSTYGLIQLAASFLGIVLTTYIPGLAIMEENSLDIAVASKMAIGLQFRCQSILNEPAALCCYLILPITLLLFGSGKFKHRYVLAGYFSLVCVASMSSTGIIVVSLLWLVKLLKSICESNIDARKLFLAFCLGLLFVIVLVLGTNVFEYFINRTFGGEGLSGLSNGTRFYALNVALSSSDSPLHILFGILTSQTVDYLPGYARAYYLYGAVGLLLFLLVMLCAAARGDDESKWVVGVFAILNIGTEIMLGNFAIYYLCFAADNRVVAKR